MTWGRRINPGRQLTPEETRFYAAGSAAARRGEIQPAERLPLELFKIWSMGWNRVGRLAYEPAIVRSVDHRTKCESMHMVRTEAETLDQALDILVLKQRAQRAAATNREKLHDWHQELHMHNIRQTMKRNSANAKRELAIHNAVVSELELKKVESIEHVIQALCHLVEEMSAFGPMQTHFPLVNQKNLIDVITKLSLMIKKQAPEFGTGRQPHQQTTRRCANCGIELQPKDWEFCSHCEPPDESIHVHSELKREHLHKLKGTERDVKELTKLLNKISKRDKMEAIDHEYSTGHVGNTDKDAEPVESTGRKENNSQ